MVPLSGIGLSSIYRVFDVNVALCTTTAARRRPSGWWRMVTSDGIKSDWERFSQKSEHDRARVISILERELRPFEANMACVSTRWAANKCTTSTGATLYSHDMQ